MLKFGVCGTAFWADNVHVPGLLANEDVELVGVWGRDAGKRDDLASKHGLRAFASFEALCDEVDALSFAVPPTAQAELAPQATARGLHVILEKPLGPSLDEANAIVEGIRSRGTSAVCFLTRMFVDEVVEFVSEARKLQPVKGEASFRSNALLQGPYASSSWRQERHGALLDAAPHGMSVLVSALGPITEVSAEWAGDGTYSLFFKHSGEVTSTLDLNLRDTEVQFAERYAFANDRSVSLPKLAYNRKATFTRASEVLVEQVKLGSEQAQSQLGLALHLVAVAAAAQESLAIGGNFQKVAPTDHRLEGAVNG